MSTAPNALVKNPDLIDLLAGAKRIALQEALGEVPLSTESITKGKLGPFKVVSTNVDYIAYYILDSIMEIGFTGEHGGPVRIYQYPNCSFETFIALYNAPSKGRFVNDELMDWDDLIGPL